MRNRLLAVLLAVLMTLAGSMAAQAATRPVIVTWGPSSATSVTGYNLFRCTVATGQTTCVPSITGTPLNGTTLISGVSYTDNPTVQASYNYAIVAVAPACTATSSVTVPCGNAAPDVSPTVPVPPQTGGAGTIIIQVP